MDRTMRFSVALIENGDYLPSLVSSLQTQNEFVEELYATFETDSVPFSAPTRHSLAHKLNHAIANAKSAYLLFLNGDIELEEETLEEFAEVAQEYPDADIIYPNEVFIAGEEERIKNYEDWYQKEQLLLPSLAIEDYLPQWAVLVKKETIQKLGGFDPRYGEHTWYAFIYKNLDKLRLKLSDLSFVNHYLSQTFVDTSYRSLLVRDIVAMHSPQEIFTSLDWSNEPVALATTYTLIGDRLAAYYDYFNAAKYYRNALMAFHNQESLKKLLQSYYQMGLFDEMKNLLQTQEPSPALKEEYDGKIEKTSKLIKELEKAVQEGKAQQVLMAAQDIAQFYQGAPFYNILGVVHYLKREPENAYRFFYKAVTMNPLDNDIIQNLVDLAKQLHKEDEVIGLMTRLTEEV